ncbi:hypothetical protein RRG08_002681 [Elysia crispata]|uniref:Uncharacterized protein n=1 Tax=Elysia crispata TaxID=231223 RepID=A0AAE0XUC5_9GAST|nr:hypothetical protein RRG08_002681 [Elysia crispata]
MSGTRGNAQTALMDLCRSGESTPLLPTASSDSRTLEIFCRGTINWRGVFAETAPPHGLTFSTGAAKPASPAQY